MKRFFALCLLIFLVTFVIIGCNSEQKSEEQYYVLIVQGEKNISDKFGELSGNDYTVVETEYITSLESAREKYPDYKIEKAPAVFIFETNGGEMKKLKLKTYDVDEANQFLKKNHK